MFVDLHGYWKEVENKMKLENQLKRNILKQEKKEKKPKHTTKWQNPKVVSKKATSTGPSKKRCLGWLF